MTLPFYEQSVYGRILIYPDDTIKDHIFILTKTKTITEDQLEALHILGCDIELTELPGKDAP